MKIVHNSVLPLGSYKAMAVGPWVLVRGNVRLSDVDLNHEAIHWEQQKELLVLPFYVLYCLLFAWELVRCLADRSRGSSSALTVRRSLWKRAYRSIAFEREAYQNEADLHYIATRRRYAWL